MKLVIFVCQRWHILKVANITSNLAIEKYACSIMRGRKAKRNGNQIVNTTTVFVLLKVRRNKKTYCCIVKEMSNEMIYIKQRAVRNLKSCLILNQKGLL